jgi:hypothetical protein
MRLPFVRFGRTLAAPVTGATSQKKLAARMGGDYSESDVSRLLFLAALALAGCTSAGPSVPAPVRAPPASLRLNPFYAKYVDAGGIPVIGSPRVPDAALLIARDIVNAMLARRSDLRRDLVRQGTRVGVIASEEGITDLPEHREWKRPARDDPRLTLCEKKNFATIQLVSDRDYWNARARGIGGIFTTVGAENLLAVPGSRYFGENILVHEFAHAIFSSIERVDPKLHAAVRRAYEKAQAEGRWERDYAAVSLQEYWAEGTQFWFDTNMLARLDESEILSHRDLELYDPALYAALRQVYGRGHRIAADPFHEHAARLNVPKGYRSADC